MPTTAEKPVHRGLGARLPPFLQSRTVSTPPQGHHEESASGSKAPAPTPESTLNPIFPGLDPEQVADIKQGEPTTVDTSSLPALDTSTPTLVSEETVRPPLRRGTTPSPTVDEPTIVRKKPVKSQKSKSPIRSGMIEPVPGTEETEVGKLVGEAQKAPDLPKMPEIEPINEVVPKSSIKPVEEELVPAPLNVLSPKPEPVVIASPNPSTRPESHLPALIQQAVQVLFQQPEEVIKHIETKQAEQAQAVGKGEQKHNMTRPRFSPHPLLGYRHAREPSLHRSDEKSAEEKIASGSKPAQVATLAAAPSPPSVTQPIPERHDLETIADATSSSLTTHSAAGAPSPVLEPVAILSEVPSVKEPKVKASVDFDLSEIVIPERKLPSLQSTLVTNLPHISSPLSKVITVAEELAVENLTNATNFPDCNLPDLPAEARIPHMISATDLLLSAIMPTRGLLKLEHKASKSALKKEFSMDCMSLDHEYRRVKLRRSASTLSRAEKKSLRDEKRIAKKLIKASKKERKLRYKAERRALREKLKTDRQRLREQYRKAKAAKKLEKKQARVRKLSSGYQKGI